MSKTTIVMFCPTAGTQSGRPGQSTNHASLNAVRANQLAADVKDPNAGLFADGSGGVSANFNGLSDESAAVFQAGKTYKMTIEEVEAL